ncbi:hypothetical protein GCM10007086_27980 [Photobacterium aphoticum]|nr:hypothetical protein GCM10007086_27980 [Photobacterium aphoticum]
MTAGMLKGEGWKDAAIRSERGGDESSRVMKQKRNNASSKAAGVVLAKWLMTASTPQN